MPACAAKVSTVWPFSSAPNARSRRAVSGSLAAMSSAMALSCASWAGSCASAWVSRAVRVSSSSVARLATAYGVSAGTKASGAFLSLCEQATSMKPAKPSAMKRIVDRMMKPLMDRWKARPLCPFPPVPHRNTGAAARAITCGRILSQRASTSHSTAMRTNTPLPTCSRMRDCAPSATSEAISMPRLSGPGCITRQPLAARARRRVSSP